MILSWGLLTPAFTIARLEKMNFPLRAGTTDDCVCAFIWKASFRVVSMGSMGVTLLFLRKKLFLKIVLMYSINSNVNINVIRALNN